MKQVYFILLLVVVVMVISSVESVKWPEPIRKVANRLRGKDEKKDDLKKKKEGKSEAIKRGKSAINGVFGRKDKKKEDGKMTTGQPITT
jgi:hypothetical protein